MMLKKILVTCLIILQILTQSAGAFEFRLILQPLAVQPIQVQSLQFSSDILKNINTLSGVNDFLFFKISDSFVNQPLVFDQGFRISSSESADKMLSSPSGLRLTNAYHAHWRESIWLNNFRGNPSSDSMVSSEIKRRFHMKPDYSSGFMPAASLNWDVAAVVNDNSNLDLVKIGSVTLADYDYDTLNRRSAKTFTYPTTDQGAVYSFDIGNQLTSIANKILPSTNIATYAYTSFDAVGNRTQMQRTYTTGSAVSTNYSYNDIYELTSTSGAQSHSYTYDSVGNRDVADSVTYTPNSLNQYSQVASTTYTNSTNGNLTSDGTSTFGYDAENRLVSFDTTGTSNDATYTYDALSRRVSKTVGGTATYFIYDGDDVIADYSSSSLLREYIHGSATDEILAMQDGSNTYYYHYDGLGSVTEITDDSGSVAENYTYDVFGAPSVTTSSIGNRYRFTGREYDEESGLSHYRHRTLHHGLGRFMQRDPIGYHDGMNLYSYAGNDSVNNIDPMGLSYLFAIQTEDTMVADRIADEAFARNSTNLAVSANCSDVPTIRLRELDTFTQMSMGLGFMSGLKMASAASSGIQDIKAGKAIQKISNLINDHLKPHDISGGVADMLGTPIVKNGKVYNHLKEMLDTLNGLRKNAAVLKNVPTKEAQKAYQNAQAAIKTITDAISGVGI